MTSFHSHSLRKGRFSGENQIYLITTVTHNRKPIFNDFILGRIVVKVMKHIHDSNRVSSLAFVIMPDHIHWLIQLKHEDFDKIIQGFKGVSARQINQHLDIQGKLWQSGYHDHALRKDEDLVATSRYIVLNPIRAGLVTNIKDYSLWDAVWDLRSRLKPLLQGHTYLVGAALAANSNQLRRHVVWPELSSITIPLSVN